jgi:hypothetical protein
MIILKKQPLPKSLDNYIATFRRLNGNPKAIPDSSFDISNWVDNPLTPTTNATSYSAVNELGFSVTINEIAYTKFAITAAGYLMLLDPNLLDGTQSFFNQVMDVEPDESEASTPVIYSNSYILKRFKSNAILISPWMGNNNTIGRTVKSLVTTKYSSIINSTLEQKIAEGKDKRNWPFNYIDCGTRWKRSYDHKRGKCIIARWTVSQVNYSQRFKFEACIFENGEIEFKYWPLPNSVYVTSNSPYTPLLNTVGIFWQGIDIGENKFRDFSILFDYARSRQQNEYGGTSLSSYIETPTYSNSSKGFGTQVSELNWPKNGAIINFLPPKNLLKILPRKSITNIDANSKIVSKGGLFDDRKTFVYNTENDVEVNMPSTLGSRLHANSSDTGDLKTQQVLVPYNGLKIRSRQIKASIDSAMDIHKSILQTSDNSFNESNKDFDHTKSFYTSGLPISEFGDGFSESLASKQQIKISVPVQVPIKLPVSESCFYYYDTGLKTWSMPRSDVSNTPELNYIDPAYVAYGAGTGDDTFNGELNIEGYNRIVETSIGFDAVGRKIVSGNLNGEGFISPNTQKSYAIGALLNSRKENYTFANHDYFNNGTLSPSPSVGKQVIKNALSHKYINSVTDNLDLAPSDNQRIDLAIDYPFLIEKVVVEFPISASNAWFNDITTVNKAHIAESAIIPEALGYAFGSIDFGGPGLTFALHCQKKAGTQSHLDLIASGTITHHLDNIASVVFKKDPGTNYYVARPAGFKSFSSPTAVISGSWNGSFYEFDGKVKLELEATVSAGVTIAANMIPSNLNGKTRAIEAFTTKDVSTLGTTHRSLANGGPAGYGHGEHSGLLYQNNPEWRARRDLAIYLQQISPIGRGTSAFSISGNSILGRGFMDFKVNEAVHNPLYIAPSEADLPADVQTGINSTDVSTNGKIEIINLYSCFKSAPSPYMIYPGEKLSLSISKTRPVINKMFEDGTSELASHDPVIYRNHILTGSHDSVYLNTGSIDITIYGSYVREGKSYNP